MKEIVVDARMLEVTGIGTYLQNLLPRLIDSPFIWRMIVSSKAYESFTWLRNLNPIILDTPFYSLKEQFDLPRVIPKSALYWTPNFNVPLFPIRAKKRIVTLHDINHLVWAPLNWVKKKFVKRLFKKAAFDSCCIITDSQFSRDEIQQHLDLSMNRIEIIPLGVDLNQFDIKPKEDDQVLKKYSLKNPYFLFVGNVKEHKNLSRLLLAFEKSMGLNHDLVVAGRNPEAVRGDDVRPILARNPLLKRRIHFLGFVPGEDLPPLYRQAASFVMPSLYEGFGLPILEAMACGSPVMTSRRASLPEVAGPHAVYVNPEEIDSIAEGLRDVLLKREVLKNEASSWCSRFCWDTAAEKHLEVFQRYL